MSAKPKSIDFSIDGRHFSTAEKTHTARELLVDFARLDPETHYLIEVKGRHQESYEDRLDESIRMHEKQTFITAALGPTPVS